MMKLIVVLFLVCTCLVVVNSSKVVVISPAVSKSVFFVLNAIAGELSARGHEVVILVPNSEQYLKNHPQVAMYPLDKFWEGLVNGTVNMNMKDMKVLEQLQFLSRMQNDLCRALLDSKILDQHRDAEIVIGVAVLSCSYIVPHILNVPHVTVQPAAMNFPILRGVGQTTPLAYIPQLESRLTNDMTFFERVKNLVFYCFSEIILKVVINWGGNDIIKKNNISADKSFEQMIADTELVLVQADFALEDALPVVPNVKLIGPVLPQPAKELDPDLETFMNSAGPEGVVLVSFGSVEVSGIRSRLADEVMARALAKLPFKVVWKIKDSKGLPIGANTKALAWIKQNDILGHPKTRVFVTHVGHNGMYESAYHGVPMIACPQWGEQYDNTARLVHRGVAVSIDVNNLDNLEADLFNAVKKITSDPSYTERIKRISQIIRSRRRTAREEAADWIEHVLTVKDMSHLKPHGNLLPFYQLYLLDIMAFFLVLGVGFVVCMIYCFKFCMKCLKRGRKEKEN